MQTVNKQMFKQGACCIPLAPSLDILDRSIKWVPMTSSDTESLKINTKPQSYMIYNEFTSLFGTSIKLTERLTG